MDAFRQDTARWRDGLAIATVAFAAYVALGRDAWHGIDMIAMANAHHAGLASHGHYVLFPWLIDALGAVAEPFGGGWHRAGLLLSALGTAIGVALTHAAARTLGMLRVDAAFAGCVVATTPAVAYFAVFVEVHGHVLAFLGLAWLQMARWAVAPRRTAAILVGFALAAAYLAHPMAPLAGAAMAPIACLASPRPSAASFVAGCAWAAACATACVVVWLAWFVLEPVGGMAAGAADPFAMLLRFARVAESATDVRWPTKFWREWWLPFLPLNLALIAAACFGPARRAALAALAAATPFVLVSAWILVDDERGAYVTMASGPMALVLAVCIRSRWARLLHLAAAVGVAFWLVAQLQCPPRTLATAEAVRAAVGRHAFAWLVGDGAGPDGQAWLTKFPRAEVVVLAGLVGDTPDRCRDALARVDDFLARQRRAGATGIVTSTTLDGVAALAPVGGSAGILHDWLSARRGDLIAQSEGVAVYAVVAR